MSQREFNKTGENSHQQVIEMFEKDNQFQAQYRDFFSKNPPALRDRYEQIEAGALGLRKEDDGSYTDFNNQISATDKQVEKLKEQTDEAMLRQNPDMDKEGFRYRNKFIIPKSVKDMQKDK
tara:strand:- start:1534 stop:1896 length:363 start_codon:yes stop_codon:yes gene_type:complete